MEFEAHILQFRSTHEYFETAEYEGQTQRKSLGGSSIRRMKKTEQRLEIILRRFLWSQKHAQRAARARITMWQQPFAQPTPLELRDRSIW